MSDISGIEFGALVQKVDGISEAVNRIEQKLFIGNGTKPLVTRLEVAEGKISALSSAWSGVNKFLLTICTALILSVGTFIWAVLVHAVSIVAARP